MNKNGVAKVYPVHRMVALTYVPNPNNLPEVNHINGIKTDNRPENLEWCTKLENIQHAWRTGLMRHTQPKSETCYRCGILLSVSRGTECIKGKKRHYFGREFQVPPSLKL